MQVKIKQLLIRSAFCSAVMCAATAANAALIVTPGNLNANTDNVISNGCDGNNVTPGLTIQGCLNTDHDFFVNFTSDETLQFGGGGQASIEAADGAFGYLNIWLTEANWTFEKLVLNIDASADGFVTFSGIPGGSSGPIALSGNGQNFFTITGEDFSSVSFVTSVNINAVDLVSDVAQVRLGGLEGAQGVPEPSLLILLGLSLFGLGIYRRASRTAA